MKHPHAANARLAACRALMDVLGGDPSASEQDIALSGLDPRDQGFARHLVYGVLRWLNGLEWLAAQLQKKPFKRRDRDLEILVLMGIFQLWQGGTAPHAAVHTTVEAARQLGKSWAAGLLNAVLRNFQRQSAELLSQLASQPERFAHPQWMLQSLRDDWTGQWADIVDANNTQPPMWLRVNTQRMDREAYADLLTEAGLKASFADEAPEAIRVEPPVPVSQLPGFMEGMVSVQDAAAQLAAGYLDLQPGQRILDACAAPGGKTCHLLERQPGIELIALDRDRARLALIRENLQRLKLSCKVLQGDATQPEPWWDGQPFDRILLDAPCSATGVIRRHPEIKWLRQPGQVDQAVSLQHDMLGALWPLLKPGGMLVYATCSVLKRENSLQISEFLSNHQEAVCTPDQAASDQPDPGRQILPGENDMDGFFYACLRKPA